jgi:hypothetical protein
MDVNFLLIIRSWKECIKMKNEILLYDEILQNFHLQVCNWFDAREEGKKKLK